MSRRALGDASIHAFVHSKQPLGGGRAGQPRRPRRGRRLLPVRRGRASSPARPSPWTEDGRSPRAALGAEMRYAIGIDLGGTNVKVAAVSGAARSSSAPPSRPTTSRAAIGPRGFARKRWLSSLGRAGPHAWMGVATPGLPSADERTVADLEGQLAGLVGLAWADLLETKATLRVINDAQAALLGEAWKGAGVGCRNAVLLTLGTGVGGAILSDGRLLKGHLGRAGHVGHMSARSGRPAPHHHQRPGRARDHDRQRVGAASDRRPLSRHARARRRPPRGRPRGDGGLAALGPSPGLRHRVDRQRRSIPRWSSWRRHRRGGTPVLRAARAVSRRRRVAPARRGGADRSRGPGRSGGRARSRARGHGLGPARSISSRPEGSSRPSRASGRPSAAPRTGSRRPSSPGAWSTCSAPATAASWSRRCGRATDRSPASTPSSSCRSPFTTSWSAPTASGRRCSSRTSPAWPSASCGTSTSRPTTPRSSSLRAAATWSRWRWPRGSSSAASRWWPS